VDAYIDHVDSSGTLDRAYIDFKISGLPDQSEVVAAKENSLQIDSILQLYP
jgi:hypothetical protein